MEPTAAALNEQLHEQESRAEKAAEPSSNLPPACDGPPPLTANSAFQSIMNTSPLMPRWHDLYHSCCTRPRASRWMISCPTATALGSMWAAATRGPLPVCRYQAGASRAAAMEATARVRNRSTPGKWVGLGAWMMGSQGDGRRPPVALVGPEIPKSWRVKPQRSCSGEAGLIGRAGHRVAADVAVSGALRRHCEVARWKRKTWRRGRGRQRNQTRMSSLIREAGRRKRPWHGTGWQPGLEGVGASTSAVGGAGDEATAAGRLLGAAAGGGPAGPAGGWPQEWGLVGGVVEAIVGLNSTSCLGRDGEG